MKTVFLSGSRRISRLNRAIRSRLDQLMKRDLCVYVGDANGADRAMQRYLADSHYQRVVVFAIESHLRNNEGGWPVEYVCPPSRSKGTTFYSAKDLVMAERADAGIVLWDGKSKGTLANIRTMLAHGKPLALYFGPSHAFLSVSTLEELATIVPSLAHDSTVTSKRKRAVQGELLSQDLKEAAS